MPGMHIANSDIVQAYDILALLPVPHPVRAVVPVSGLIERQEDFSDLPYGRSTVGKSGCGVVAVYNLLIAMGRPAPLHRLLGLFERYGAAFGGRLGTAPRAALRLLSRQGFRCRTASEPEDFARLERGCDHFLLTIFNDSADLKVGLHTMYVERTPSGFVGHNYAGGKTKPSPHIAVLAASLNAGRARAAYLIAVRQCPDRASQKSSTR